MEGGFVGTLVHCTQGEGDRMRSIPDRGGVRWSLFGERRIGDGVLVDWGSGWESRARVCGGWV